MYECVYIYICKKYTYQGGGSTERNPQPNQVWDLVKERNHGEGIIIEETVL